jgi:CheY-like chemotaxis protein
MALVAWMTKSGVSGMEGRQRDQASASRQPTVLVIDDDNIARSLMCEVLAPRCRVIELSSPIGATRIASSEGVDVVVLDVFMPNLRGDMVAKLFRNNPRLKHVGVILVSGDASEQLKELGETCQADEVVCKRDVRTDLLQAVLRVRLEARRRSVETR